MPEIRSSVLVLKCCAVIALAAVLCSGGPANAAQEVLDGVAAVVNGDVITFSQVRELVGARERSLRDTLHGQELVEKIKEARLGALKDLIDRQLILQEFRKNKFSIPDYIIEDHIQTIIRTEFGGNRVAFVRTLEAQGLTLSRFRELETEKIIVQAMRQKNMRGEGLMIPPQQIDEYYAKNREAFTTPEQIKLRMIVLKKGSGDGSSKKQMAEEIRAKMTAGGEFEKLAQMYSEDSSQDTGGDWGWVDRKMLNETLTKAAFSLKPGQVSRVIELGDNYYLLYVEAKKSAVVKPLSQVRGEIEGKLLQESRQKLQEKWIEGLRQKAYIKTF